uniref:Ig-like domain-containing protein n=1 Tax=Naja naja TaxID=35670 RepID=A0A8C6XZ90_NAJNA
MSPPQSTPPKQLIQAAWEHKAAPPTWLTGTQGLHCLHCEQHEVVRGGGKGRGGEHLPHAPHASHAPHLPGLATRLLLSSSCFGGMQGKLQGLLLQEAAPQRLISGGVWGRERKTSATINLTEETISLTCLAVSNPASEIEWYFNGQLIPISPEVLTRKIIPENSGDYACQATNPTSKMTSKTTMEIDMIDFLPKPNVTAKPNSAIEELHPVSFFCSAPKDLMITWFKDGELYTSESHLSDNNKTLSIASVTKSDAGGYQCQITNHTSRRISDILSFNVVYGPDTPAIQPTQRYYNEHTNVVLTCKADSFPQPRYIWFHNGKEIDTGQKLLLEDFTEDKTGSYICQAGNDLLQKKRNSSSLEIYLEKSE